MIKLIKLNIRLMMHQANFYIAYGVTLLLMLLLISQLFSAVDKGLKIRVGVVDLEHSDFSEFMLQRLSKNTLLEVVAYNQEDIETALKNQDVEVVFIIDQGTEDKVISGNTKNLLRMVYLEENYFALMLSDIVSGEILDEICLSIAADYFNRGMEHLDLAHENNPYNEVYFRGKKLFDDHEENYYVNITYTDNQNPQGYDLSERNLLMEKMILGIVFILIAFFSLYIGLGQKVEHKKMLVERLKCSGVSNAQFYIAQLITCAAGTIFMSLPMVFLLVYYGENQMLMFVAIILYGLNISGFVILIGYILNKTTTYIIVGLSSLIGMGIISGSFFSINLENPLILSVARSFPMFYTMNVYFDKSLIWEYSIYTSIYLIITCIIGIQLERRLNHFKIRRPL